MSSGSEHLSAGPGALGVNEGWSGALHTDVSMAAPAHSSPTSWHHVDHPVRGGGQGAQRSPALMVEAPAVIAD